MTTSTSVSDAVSSAGSIVVGFDDSEPSLAAVRWAAGEAARREVPLRIVSAFLPEDLFATSEEIDLLMAKVAQRAIDEARSVSATLSIEHQEIEDLAVPVLLSESAGAALLVVGSRGRGGFKGLLMGSVARQCVHRAPGPVAVVDDERTKAAVESAATQSSTDDGRGEAKGSVLVGVDGSACSIEALRWAADEARSLGCALVPVMAWHWPISYGVAAAPSNFDPASDAAVTLEGAVSLVRSTHPDVTIDGRVIEGWPAQVLTKRSSDAALLVVGSRGLGAIAEMWLGSVSEYCVSHAHCPVVVMHGARTGGARRH